MFGYRTHSTYKHKGSDWVECSAILFNNVTMLIMTFATTFLIIIKIKIIGCSTNLLVEPRLQIIVIVWVLSILLLVQSLI